MPNVNEPKNLRGKNDVAKDYRGENTAWRSTGRYLWLAIRAHRFEKGFSMESGTDLLKVWSCRFICRDLLSYFSLFTISITIYI